MLSRLKSFALGAYPFCGSPGVLWRNDHSNDNTSVPLLNFLDWLEGIGYPVGVLGLSAKRRRKISLEQLIAKARVDIVATRRGELLVFLFRLRYAVISRVVILANSGLVRCQPNTAVEESRSRRVFNHFLELQQRTHLACCCLRGISSLLVTQHTFNRGHLPKIRRIERLRREVTPREQNDSRSLNENQFSCCH